MQVVTEQDVLPAGWQCESCSTPFRVGDNAYATLLAVTPDGDPVEGDWRCITCWSD